MELRYGSPNEVGLSDKKFDYIEKLVSGWVETGITPSVTYLVARKGVIVANKAFGKSGPEKDAPDLQLDTIFPLASLSKPITATCIMILQEDGLLDLSRSVSQYIPEFIGEGKSDVLISHLLTHTPGIIDEEVQKHIQKKLESAGINNDEIRDKISFEDYLKLGFDTPMWKKPGEAMQYFNYGYSLLGLIVQIVSGKSLQAFAKERIFDPLGMKDTNYAVPESLQNRVVNRKAEYPGGGWFCTQNAFVSQNAAGGVYSTTMDMAIFGQMFLNRGKYGKVRILSPISVDEMICNHTAGIPAQYGDQVFPNSNWGYGWNLKCGKVDDSGILRSQSAYDHGGFGGVRLLIDPVYNMLWVYFIVETGDVYSKEGKIYYTRDLFNNAVMSSIEEEHI